MKKYFVRGIIFAGICLFYSTQSLSLARERSRSSVISNHHLIAAKFLASSLIREWISPIYRFFYSEKIQNQANNGYFQANLPCDREYIEIFVDSSIGRYLIKKMLKSGPIARKQIIPRIINNIKFAGSQDGRLFITEIIEKYPDAREQVISCIINNDARERVISCIINNFDRLIESWDGRLLVKEIIEKYPDAREQIIPCIVSNFDLSLIREIIENNPSAGSYLIEQIVLSVAEFPHRWEVIIYFIKNSSARAQIISCIKENLKKKKVTKLPFIIFRYFCEEFPHDECLRSRLKEDSHEYSIEGVIKRFHYRRSCPKGKNDRLKSSLPTIKHIEKYRKSITKLIERNAFSPNFLSMLDRVFKKEVELEKSGYVAFKHGQRWGYGLPEKWFTTLWAITKEKPVTDFIFLHVKPLLKNDNLAGETAMRERLLRGEWNSNNDEKYLLFMNYPLFGNVSNAGSSSIYFAIKNHNESKINISLKDVFNYLGYKDIYKKYEKQLQELEQEYQGLSEYGSMVVIGVPEDRLADSVYLTNFISDGPKVKIDIEGIGKTDDIKTIITTLRHAPHKIKNSDWMEFALIMTQDEHGGLNPESGIKVHMFDAADPEKLAAFKEKEHRLLKQIKQEIEQEKSKESAATAGQFIRSAL